MSRITTNPNPFVATLLPTDNVAKSATGFSSSDLLNAATNTLNIDSIGTVNNNAFLTIANNTNFSNASIYINGTQILTSNSINGIDYLAFQVGGQEKSRITANGFGIGTTNPAYPLHIVGDTLITGSLTVNGSVITPSDPSLKDNIRPYILSNLPEPVSFTWKSNGKKDIGVLASDLLEIEPTCVSIQNGVKHVDYSKLTVLCLAELKSLRETVDNIKQTVKELQASASVSP
jgi:hypothetical protein